MWFKLQACVLHDFLDGIGVEDVVNGLETNSEHLCLGHFIYIGCERVDQRLRMMTAALWHGGMLRHILFGEVVISIFFARATQRAMLLLV